MADRNHTGRSLRTAQWAVDRLLSDSWPAEDLTEDPWAFTRPGLQQHRGNSYIREVSASTRASAEIQGKSDKSDDGKATPPFEEPPELLDSNPSFRAEMSRRAWRAKRRAEQGPSTRRSLCRYLHVLIVARVLSPCLRAFIIESSACNKFCVGR